jgi:diguanylate cyclase (GGDEF)-like protein
MLNMDSSLQTENYSLRQQLESLLHEARLNENKMRRFDQLERQLIGTHTLADLVYLLLNDYRQAFGIEFVSLVLVDPEYEAARILGPENTGNTVSNPMQGLIFIQSPTLLETLYGESHLPLLSAFLAHEHSTLFHAGSHTIASLALLPLRRQGELIGSLHLGSTNPQRYSASAGTAFLERLANIIAICLETALIQERLKLVGLTDGLTGVQNRRYFEHRVPVEVSQAKRHQQPLACMFLDIDKFKRINDTHGHQTGDEVLRAVAKLIQGQLRASDTIARFGGEEFIVLLPQTPGHYALEIAERIRQTIAQQPITGSNREKIAVTISIGLAMLPQHSEQTDISKLTENLIARADKAVYQAKHNGRNQVVSDGVPVAQAPRFAWQQPASWLDAGMAQLTKLIDLSIAKTAALRHFVG